jgi:hypothetical protein
MALTSMARCRGALRRRDCRHAGLRAPRTYGGRGPPLLSDGYAESEKDAKLAQKLGQLQPFLACCIPTGMHGPTGIF